MEVVALQSPWRHGGGAAAAFFFRERAPASLPDALGWSFSALRSEASAMHLFGIDLGGTKIEGVIIDPERPEHPVRRVRRPTGAQNGYAHVLGVVEEIVEDLRAHAPGVPPAAIGIGTPGTLDPKSRMLRGSNAQCLNGHPFKDDLEARLGMAVIMENDANCFALAEATLGAARGYETVFGVILGTGCGGGFVVHERVLRGCHGTAGEWGQVVVEPGGLLSAYGTRGINEVYLAGPALERFYKERSGIDRPLKEIATNATADPHAAETLERLGEYFVRAVATIVNTFDPHAIVIGGGVGNLDLFYSTSMRSRLSAAIFAPSFEAALLRPRLGDSAGVFGAAMLTRESTWETVPA
jgi:fructokinase